MEKKLLFTLLPDGIQREALIISFLIVSFTLSYLILPWIIKIARSKELFDTPNERSSHSISVPRLGGVVFYFTLIMFCLLSVFLDWNYQSFYLLFALLILFCTGLCDDIRNISARNKLLGQIFAITFIVIVMNNINLNGFVGIYELPLFFRLLFIYFFFLTLINSYNLIDGIDGLAGFMGILALSIFGYFFYTIEANFNMFISVIGVGSILAFLRFNLSKEKKLFMGDTGSLLIGFLIAYQGTYFLTLSEDKLINLGIEPSNALLLLFAIILIPIVDVLRVIVIRLNQKKSILSSDRNHMHHVLIDKGLSHVKASSLITFSGVLIFIVAYVSSLFAVYFLISIMIIISIFTYHGINFIKNHSLLFPNKMNLYSKTIKFINTSYQIVKNGTSMVLRTFL